MKPIHPAVLTKIADHLQRNNRYGPLDSVTKAAEIVTFMHSMGVEVVMPGWVPVIDERRPATNHPQRRTWEDLAKAIDIDVTGRQPWLPYDA